MDLGRAYLSLCVASTLVALAAAVGAWEHRRRVPAAAPLALVMVGLAEWCGLQLVQAVLPDGPWREASSTLTILGASAVIAGFALEVRLLVDPDRRPGRLLLAALAVHPAVMIAVTLTNPGHHLFAEFLPGAGRPWMPWHPGPLFWAHLGYSYLLLGVSLAHLAWTAATTTSPLLRRQLTGTLVAALLPTIGNVITVTRPSGLIAPDLTPAFVLLCGIVHYWTVLRQGLLRVLPVARGVVLEHVGDAIYVTDPAGRLVDHNPAAGRLTRRLVPDLPSDLLGLPVNRLLPAGRHRRALTGGEYHVELPDGTVDVDLRVSDLLDRKGHLTGRVVVARDVTELNDQRRRLADVNGRLVAQLETIEALRRELAELAVRDELTGLHNRRHLGTQLEADLAAARSDALPLSVVVVDIDHFKAVNDRHGHPVGDALLVATAHAMCGALRAGDTVARYGGEEFVIILPGASMPEARHLAEVVRARCARVFVDGRTGPVSTTVSAGVATFPDAGWTGEELLARADEALYQAKRAGRDRVVCVAR